MTTGLAVREQPAGGALAIWDREQLEVIKTLICPGASDAELALFGQVCQRTGLDPFSRQIYGIMRSQRQQVNGEWRTIEKLSIQTSIDGFRLIAERSGKYGGQIGPQWCGEDGVWRDVWLAREYPSAARVGVIRTDWQEPLYAVARWDSYVQTYKPRNANQEVVGAMWQRMPDVMLAKVAESLALRRAFPAELSGLYTTEEMQQADRERPDDEHPRPVRTVADNVRDRTNAKHVEVDGQVVKSNDGKALQPASAEDRAKFEASWKKGCEKAISVGVAPDDKPDENATVAELRKATFDLKEAIDAREKLVGTLLERVALANEHNAGLAVPDPLKLTDAEIHDQIATCDRILDAAEQAPDQDEAF